MLHETVDNSSLINKSRISCNNAESIDTDQHAESIDTDQHAESIDTDQHAESIDTHILTAREHVPCPICFENIENSDIENQDEWDAMIFECKHYVCTSCSIEMIIHDTFKTCPLCRKCITIDSKYNGIIALIQTYKQSSYLGNFENSNSFGQNGTLSTVNTNDIESYTPTMLNQQNIHARAFNNQVLRYHDSGNDAHYNERLNLNDERREFECDRDFLKCCGQLACSGIGILLLYVFFLQ
jgi:hypothetical protein